MLDAESAYILTELCKIYFHSGIQVARLVVLASLYSSIGQLLSVNIGDCSNCKAAGVRAFCDLFSVPTMSRPLQRMVQCTLLCGDGNSMVIAPRGYHID